MQQWHLTLLALWLSLALVGGIAQGSNLLGSDDADTVNALTQAEQITAPSGSSGFAPLKWVGATYEWIKLFFQAGTLTSPVWSSGPIENLIRVCAMVLIFGTIVIDIIQARLGG